jgi:hypothetical protein
MPNTIESEPTTNVSEEKLLEAVQRVDWKEHWREVIDIMSDESTAYEEARAKSLEGAAQKVFL